MANRKKEEHELIDNLVAILLICLAALAAYWLVGGNKEKFVEQQEHINDWCVQNPGECPFSGKDGK